MRITIKRVFYLFTFIFIVSAFLIASAERTAAQTNCTLTVTKDATPADDTIFTFTTFIGAVITQFPLLSGESNDVSFDAADGLFVVEALVPRWGLVDVSCEDLVGITVLDFERGLHAICDVSGGTGTCTFRNQNLSFNIPTLSEWGMIAAAAGLGLIGVFFAVRRRREARA